MSKKIVALVFVFSFLQDYYFTQNDFLSFNANRNRLQQNGMLFLGGWSIVNMGSGAIGMINTEGSTKHFHQMNAMWNSVNFGLALSGYLSARKENFENYSLYETLNKQRNISNAFLFNSALNFTYIGTGFFLKERSLTNFNQKELLKGWGNSLILQGSFLLVFDLTNYISHQFNRKRNLDPKVKAISLNPQHLGFVIHL